MVNKNPSFRIILTLITAGILLFPSSIALGFEISTDQLQNSLKQKDEICNSSGYVISYTMTKNPMLLDPEQGLSILDCNSTWAKDGSLAIKIIYCYEHPPVFVPPESGPYESFEYQENGSLVIWRTMEKFIIFSPERNESIEKYRPYLVYPNGKVEECAYYNTTLLRFPIGRLNNIYEFNHFKLATGRDFSDHLRSIKSIKTLSLGFAKMTSNGSYGPGLRGIWELTLDPNCDYLVREGTFTREGENQKEIIISSTGVMKKDKIILAKYGTLKYSNLLEVSVEVTDISKVVGPNKLYEEVLSRLNSPLPPGATILDMRGEKPVRTTVK